jgi:hypothetical protein
MSLSAIVTIGFEIGHTTHYSQDQMPDQATEYAPDQAISPDQATLGYYSRIRLHQCFFTVDTKCSGLKQNG